MKARVTGSVREAYPGTLTVATRRQSPDQGFEMMTFAHIFKSCSQDNLTVQIIMSNVLGKLKEMMPTLRFVYYRQDNAGCYRSSNTILGAVKAGEACGITVRRLDFSDPQGGKGACDRKAATIKAHIKVHLNKGRDVVKWLMPCSLREVCQVFPSGCATTLSPVLYFRSS